MPTTHNSCTCENLSPNWVHFRGCPAATSKASSWDTVEEEFDREFNRRNISFALDATQRLIILDFIRTHLDPVEGSAMARQRNYDQKLIDAAREEGYLDGQKHAFGVDRKTVFEEGRIAERREYGDAYEKGRKEGREEGLAASSSDAQDGAYENGVIAGRKLGLKEALELVPEESIVSLFDFPLDKFPETHAESDGWNTCRAAIINAITDKMK